MQQTLRIGIAGLGRLGMRHAQALAQQTRGCTLVAACSPLAQERDWAAQQLGLSATYESLEQMLAHPGLDAVVLVTPTSLHADQTIAVLQAGKHVFVEKPLALNVPDCQRCSRRDWQAFFGALTNLRPERYRRFFCALCRNLGRHFYGLQRARY